MKSAAQSEKVAAPAHVRQIVVRDVTRVYHLGEVEVRALRGVNLDIDRGEFVVVMGASGSGKSTFLNVLGCLDRPTNGRYLLEGEDVSRKSADQLAELRNRRFGFVFQSFNLLARTTALENTELPLFYSPMRLEAQREQALAALDRVGLADRAGHYASQLSGGQQQRVAIARALVNHPSIILADEPTGNVDSETSAEIMELFRRLNREEGMTMVVVTHDPEVAAYGNRRVLFRDGLIVDGRG